MCLRPTYQDMFACAVYTGLRRGELVALQKRDIDLEAGTIRVGRSWEADTTKGGAEALLPIHPELRPYLEHAIGRSPSELVFPRASGQMFSRHVDLASILRRAMRVLALSSAGSTSAAAARRSGGRMPSGTRTRCSGAARLVG
jgi:integrase